MSAVVWTELCVSYWVASHKGQWLSVRPSRTGRQYQARINGRTFTHHVTAEQARAAAEIGAGYFRETTKAPSP